MLSDGWRSYKKAGRLDRPALFVLASNPIFAYLSALIDLPCIDEGIIGIHFDKVGSAWFWRRWECDEASLYRVGIFEATKDELFVVVEDPQGSVAEYERTLELEVEVPERNCLVMEA